MLKKLSLIILYSSLTVFGSYSQKNTAKAAQLARKAIAMIDQGNVEESLALLEKANKYDPESPLVTYQLAYASYLNEHYRKAITILEDKILIEENVPDVFYQLLGNSYDAIQEKDSAMVAYNLGLYHYPESGRLYYESGVLKYTSEEYYEAVDLWESGIKVDPAFAANYFQLAEVLSHSDEKMWTLLYGELFINLEKKSMKTAEVSKLMYTLLHTIFYNSKLKDPCKQLTAKGFEFNKGEGFSIKNVKDQVKNFEGAYAVVFSEGASKYLKQKVDLEAIYETRKEFLINWFEDPDLFEKYPNVVLNLQKLIYDKGYFKPYTYWLFSEGNYEEFNEFIKNNERLYNNFTKFYETLDFLWVSKDVYARKDYLKMKN